MSTLAVTLRDSKSERFISNILFGPRRTGRKKKSRKATPTTAHPDFQNMSSKGVACFLADRYGGDLKRAIFESQTRDREMGMIFDAKGRVRTTCKGDVCNIKMPFKTGSDSGDFHTHPHDTWPEFSAADLYVDTWQKRSGFSCIGAADHHYPREGRPTIDYRIRCLRHRYDDNKYMIDIVREYSPWLDKRRRNLITHGGQTSQKFLKKHSFLLNLRHADKVCSRRGESK